MKEPFTEVAKQVALHHAVHALTSKGLVVERSLLIGSAYINGAGEDIDVLIKITDNVATLSEIALADGWKLGGSARASDKWESWNCTAYGLKINLILTDNERVYETWRASSEVCRYLSLKLGGLKKQARVAIHKIIQEGASHENADHGVDPNQP